MGKASRRKRDRRDRGEAARPAAPLSFDLGDDGEQGSWLDQVASIKRAHEHQARQAELALERAVRNARGCGATWSQIAEAAGVTTQSAHKRWSEDQASEAMSDRPD